MRDRKEPEISVLMSVFNGADFLRESIDSVLGQSYRDFEFIIFDDCSTDNGAEIIESYDDERILLYRNEKNIGLTKTLNIGLDKARGKYIARMDYDDICEPDRFKKQYEYLKVNPDVGICGSLVKTFGDVDGFIPGFPSSHEELKCALFFENPLPHSSVMMKAELLRKHNLKYDEEYIRTQDYDLWERASNHFRLYNIPESLLHLRMHGAQIRSYDGKGQGDYAKQVRTRQLQALVSNPSDHDSEMHEKIAARDYIKNINFMRSSEEWFRKIISLNAISKYFPEKEFNIALAERWFDICELCSELGYKTWLRYIKSPLRKYIAGGMKKEKEFFVKCLKKDKLE